MNPKARLDAQARLALLASLARLRALARGAAATAARYRGRDSRAATLANLRHRQAMEALRATIQAAGARGAILRRDGQPGRAPRPPAPVIDAETVPEDPPASDPEPTDEPTDEPTTEDGQANNDGIEGLPVYLRETP